MKKKVVKPGLAEQIVDEIINQIGSGELGPGDKLPSEIEMTHRFNVSRISLREGIRTLIAKGYIVSYGKQGKYVNSLVEHKMLSSLCDLVHANRTSRKEFFEMKKLLFSESALLAASRAQVSEVKKMQSVVDTLASVGTKHEKGLLTYIEFLKILSSSTGNSVYSHMLVEVINQIEDLYRSGNVFTKNSSFKKALLLLEKSVGSIEQNNGKRAKSYMSAHIDEVERLFQPV